MKEALPGVSRVAVLWNSANPTMVRSFRDARAAAATLAQLPQFGNETARPWGRAVRMLRRRRRRQSEIAM